MYQSMNNKEQCQSYCHNKKEWPNIFRTGKKTAKYEDH